MNDMNKGIIIVGIGILLLVSGSLYIVSQKSQQKEQAKMPQEKTAMKAKEDSAGSRYVEYSKATILDQAATSRRVLFFYANWCPICKPADADFRANSSKIPADVTVIRVNYNDTDTDQEEKDLAKKYAVTYQHTFVQIDPQGKAVTKWNGGQINELLANIK